MPIISPFTMFFLLAAWHALADYPLQGDFLSKAKNRISPIPGVPWFQAMGAHALIHAVGVGIVTGSIGLAALEFVAHGVIDDMKCRGRIGFNMDQFLHLTCKAAWCFLAWTFA